MPPVFLKTDEAVQATGIERAQPPPSGGVPEAQRVVCGGGGECPPVRGEGKGDDLRTVPRELVQEFSSRGIANADGVVIAAGGQQVSVG